MGDPRAHAHTGYRHHVGEHLNSGMNVYRPLELAKTNDEGAGGEENDKGQAHDCAVCHGHLVKLGEERSELFQLGGFSSLLSCARTCSARTPSRLLGACHGSCILVSISYFKGREEAIPNAMAVARAESFMLSRKRVMSVGVEWLRFEG